MDADTLKFERVQHAILEPMQRLYQPPRAYTNDELVQVLRQYFLALQDFGEHTLAAGWGEVVGTWAKGVWPPPAVIVLACRKVQMAKARDARHVLSASGKAVQEREWFDRACERHGLNSAVMARPNLWWLQPRDLWRPEWREDEVPKGERPNRRTLAEWLAVHGRNADGSVAEQQARDLVGGLVRENRDEREDGR